ncbi:MAG: NAD(P)-binding domain-containing protein [Gemmatimonadaceae bacterium]|nr:NAD(P)-binding domain-containing protein [Gemmatimonadaceae bacterium]
MKTASAPDRRPPARVERYEAIVIGGGQAGLAAGHELARREVDFAILSDEARVGDNWRRRWDSLRLFTPARYSGLPGMPFPASPYHLADKDEMGDYLERYAERFDLPVRLNARVASLRHDGEHFVIRTESGAATIEASNVIVATGAFQRARVPEVARLLSPESHQLHSSEYRTPFALPLGPALVVGAGNSGAQIALELARYRKVWLAGRDTGHLPRRFLGRDVFDWIWPIARRATAETSIGRRMRANIRASGDALIGIAEREIREAGISRVDRVDEVRGGQPVCGGTVLEPRVVVWCTGFAPDYRWIDLPIFESDGYPRHSRGVVAEVPGLYFVGLRFQHRLSSSLIGGVGDDARFVAEQAAARREALVPG